jgi:hypothetical protein
VNLAANTNRYTVRWYNPRTGQTTTNANVSGGSASQSFTKPDSNDWVLHLKAIVPTTAVIDIQGNGVTITNGDVTPSVSDSTDFGSVSTSAGSVARTFTIQNYGALPLTVSNLTLTGSADFTATALPAGSVLAGGSTTFSVTFDPSTNGSRSATVVVRSSDTNHNPYTFAIQGTGVSLTSGLVGWWKLNETNGTVASDSSGNNNPGTLFNGPVWVAGRFGNGLSFDGSNDYEDMGDPASSVLDFGASQSFSYGGWIKPGVLDVTGRRFISKRNGTGPANVGFDLGVNTDQGLLAEIADGTTEKTTSSMSIPLTVNQWYHAMVVVDRATGQMRVYLDGVEKANLSLTGLGSLASATALNLGRASGDSTRSFLGVLDDVRIYNRALSASEIAALVNPPAPVFLPPTISGGQLTLNWTGEGQLEIASALTGAWVPILPTPSSPFTLAVVPAENRFFRINAGP